MAKFKFNEPMVGPILRKQDPIQIPSGGTDSASIILQAAGLSQEREKDKQSATQGLINSLLSFAELQQRRREAQIKDKEANALIELQAAQTAMQKRAAGGPSPLMVGGEEGVFTPTTSGGTVDFPPKKHSLADSDKTFINPITGETMVMPGRAVMAAPPKAGEAQDQRFKALGYINKIKKLEGILEDVPSGRLTGRAAQVVANVFGVNPSIVEGEALANLLVPGTAKYIGSDVGNLAQNEQLRSEYSLFLNAKTVEERKRILGNLVDIAMQNYADQEPVLRGAYGKKNPREVSELMKEWVSLGMKPETAARKGGQFIQMGYAIRKKKK